ncbi:MAG: hypothetical protein ACJ8FY_18095 [Gemmataceae bacterium]
MATKGWTALLEGAPWFRGKGKYPIDAYSEYIPPPRPYCKAYVKAEMPAGVDEYGWPISAYEEALELQPGLEHLAQQVIKALVHLGRGEPAHGISKGKLTDNPYWPTSLSERAGALPHERFVALLSLAFSRTLDDKGRVRWTFFGGSEQGPEKAFWKSFWKGPRQEISEEAALGYLRTVLLRAYEVPADRLTNMSDLKGLGFRILPDDNPLAPHWRVDRLPGWAGSLVWKETDPVDGVKYLLTFRPFNTLPESVQKAYLGGQLNLLPFPGSLLGWGIKPYHEMSKELPLAVQVPLQQFVARHEAWPGMRVPQSGWLHEPRSGKPEPDSHRGPLRNTYKRTHRWARVHRDEDELSVVAQEDKLAHVLFSTDPHDLGLYGKPMARNAQIWTSDFQPLLDGPNGGPEEIARAGHALKQGGLFGYRFQFPAMRVGQHEIYWHRPLVAYQCPKSGDPK